MTLYPNYYTKMRDNRGIIDLESGWGGVGVDLLFDRLHSVTKNTQHSCFIPRTILNMEVKNRKLLVIIFPVVRWLHDKMDDLSSLDIYHFYRVYSASTISAPLRKIICVVLRHQYPPWLILPTVLDGGGILFIPETLLSKIHQVIEAWWRIHA